MFSPEQLAKIRARENDPAEDARARERADKVTASLDKASNIALMGKAVAAPTPRAKVILLRRLADNLGVAAGPLSACTKGCNHCCKMPVVLTEAEAKEIAKATGARMAVPKYAFPAKAEHEFDGVACPFLVDGACSIYEHRPFFCRTHYVMNDDAVLCEIVPGETITTKQLNVRPYQFAYAQTFGEHGWRRMADVRRFFPHGLNKKGSK